MKKLFNIIIIFYLFTSSIFAADEIEKGKTLLKSLSKKSLTKKETISFLKEYVIILEDERGDGEVTYVFDDENYTRYKGTEIISSDAWRFSKLGALRLFNEDVKMTWKIKPNTKKTENLINIKTKFDPVGKLYEFEVKTKKEFLDQIEQIEQAEIQKKEAIEKAKIKKQKKLEQEKLAVEQKLEEEKRKLEEERLAAENVLPPCQGEDDMQWTNCFGSYLKKDLKRDGKTRDFTGEFGSSPGKRDGKGTGAVYKNGNLQFTFDGEYKNDKLIRGTITWPSGQKYVGEFKDGKVNGQGTHTWPSGEKFVGEFKDGEENGQGTYTYSNGEKFVGEYKDGERNGQGTHTWPDGDKEVVVYKDGEIVKIISSTIKKESSSSSSSSSTLSGYEHCKSVWVKLINIRDGYSKNSSDYYRLDALVQTAFDMWTAYKGTNAKDTGNCDRLLSLGNN